MPSHRSPGRAKPSPAVQPRKAKRGLADRSPADRSAAVRRAVAPVARDTVQDRVYAELGDALICGRLQPGQQLTIRDLAAAFDTSVMPVREALRRLIAEKALDGQAQRSVRVPPMTAERLLDLRRTRLLVEGHAAELAAAHVTPALLAQLAAADAAYIAAAEAGDADQELLCNQRFHFTLYEACASPSLLAIIRSLWLQSGPYIRTAVERHSDQTRASQRGTRGSFHSRIVAALRKRDIAAVRRALEADLSWAFDLLEKR
ncbi:GntR family transcriptional regulator [Ferrovibrio terrae]|uniref:GntR family transcriptional regulator n=1 Tax=Ferrovibrio terrae TaxID=2594003 RepID=UPI00313772BE